MAWFWNLLVLRSHGVLLPGAAFFEAIVPASAAAAATCEQLQATDSLEKSCFSRISNDISSSSSRHQFCEQPQATESVDKCCFSRFPDDTLGSFLAWFWTLLVLPSHGVLLPGAAFFEAVLPASAAAAAATSSASRRRQQNLSTNAVFLDFSRFPDDTLGSFFAWFWTLLVLPSHGVLLPGAAFFEAVLPASAAAAAATSSASSRRQRRQQNLSTLLVLQSHGVLLPGAAFFEAVLPASAAAAAGNRISRQMLFF